MSNDLRNQVLEVLKPRKAKKERYTFILTEQTKLAFAQWCEDQGVKESPTLDALIKEFLPASYKGRTYSPKVKKSRSSKK